MGSAIKEEYQHCDFFYTKSEIEGYVDCYIGLYTPPTDLQIKLWNKLGASLDFPMPGDSPEFLRYIKVKNDIQNLNKVNLVFKLTISVDEIVNNTSKYIPETWINPETKIVHDATRDRDFGTVHKNRRTKYQQQLVEESFALLKQKNIVIFEYVHLRSKEEILNSPIDKFYAKKIQVKRNFFGSIVVEDSLIDGIDVLHLFANSYQPIEISGVSTNHKSNELHMPARLMSILGKKI